MFRTKSKTEQAKDKVAQAQELSASTAEQIRERLVPAVEHAAEVARDWGKPRVDAARDWAKPRVEHGIEVAAPKLEKSVQELAPRVDSARDKIVDELLPRIAEAISAAAAASLAARDEAVSRGGDAALVLKGEAVAKPKRRGRKLLLLIGLGGAAAAGFAAFKRSAPKDDPWATPLQEPYIAPAAGRSSSVTETDEVSAPAPSPTAPKDATAPEATTKDSAEDAAEENADTAKTVRGSSAGD